jgi:glycosyltransferase 2 family protein
VTTKPLFRGGCEDFTWSRPSPISLRLPNVTTHIPTSESEAQAVSQRGSWTASRRAKLAVASLLVIALFAWVLRAGKLPVIPNASSMDEAAWWTFGGYALSWAAVLYLRYSRWYHLLAAHYPVNRRRVLVASLLGFAALSLFPFRTGEFVRPALVRQKDVLSGSAAMGTIAAERIADGLFLSLLVVLALSSSETVDPLPTRIGDLPVSVAMIPPAAYFSATVFAVLMVFGALFYWNRERTERWTDRAVGWISKSLAATMSRVVGQLAAGLGCLRKPKVSVPFLLSSVAQWGVAVLGVWMLMKGLGLGDVTVSRATAVLGILGLGVLTPGAPGHFGSFQIAVYAGLALYYPPAVISGPGAALVFILYTTQIGLPIIGGGVGLLLQRAAAAAQSNPSPASSLNQ